jgi:hypothetical protein
MNVDELEVRFKFTQGDTLTATIAAEATFYFEHTHAVVSALPNVYERIVDMMGRHAVFILVGTHARRPRKFRAQDRGLVAGWANSGPNTDKHFIQISSGPTAASHGAWSFELSLEKHVGVEERRLREEFAKAAFGIHKPNPDGPALSYLSVTAPLTSLLPHPHIFRDLAMGVARALPFRSGHAGLGLAYDRGDPEWKRDEQLAAWNRRYRGLDVGSPDCSAPFASERVRGVNWLTMLDHDLLGKVGGRGAVEAIGPDVRLHDLEHGVAIQAGDAPQLGDVNELEDMTSYVKVNRLIKPIRAEEMYPPHGMNREQAREWLARFDEA